MTKSEFIIQYMNITNDLLQAGITSCNIHEAREQLDYLFDEFEEFEGVDDVDLSSILDDIATKEMNIPENLKQYFHVIDSLATEESSCTFEEYICFFNDNECESGRDSFG